MSWQISSLLCSRVECKKAYLSGFQDSILWCSKLRLCYCTSKFLIKQSFLSNTSSIIKSQSGTTLWRRAQCCASVSAFSETSVESFKQVKRQKVAVTTLVMAQLGWGVSHLAHNNNIVAWNISSIQDHTIPTQGLREHSYDIYICVCPSPSEHKRKSVTFLLNAAGWSLRGRRTWLSAESNSSKSSTVSVLLAWLLLSK